MKAKRENPKLIDLNDADSKAIELVCGFCKTSVQDEAVLKSMGKLLGPYEAKHKRFYVHEYCAMWCPKVHEKDGVIHGINEELDRSLGMRCQLCKRFGAGQSCFHKDCNKCYHIKCL